MRNKKRDRLVVKAILFGSLSAVLSGSNPKLFSQSTAWASTEFRLAENHLAEKIDGGIANDRAWGNPLDSARGNIKARARSTDDSVAVNMDNTLSDTAVSNIDPEAVIPNIYNENNKTSDKAVDAINRRYYILQHNNDGPVFGLGNSVKLEVVYPVHQSVPKSTTCEWSFDKEISHLEISYDRGDRCVLTLEYPYKPQPISSQFSYQAQAIVTSEDGFVSEPVTRTLSFRNHLYASLIVNSSTLSKVRPIAFNVLSKNKNNPFPSEISCSANLIEKPFEVVLISDNGCSGEVVLTPENRLSSVAKKSLHRDNHRVGIVIKYNGLNVGRQVINFSIES